MSGAATVSLPLDLARPGVCMVYVARVERERVMRGLCLLGNNHQHLLLLVVGSRGCYVRGRCMG